MSAHAAAGVRLGGIMPVLLMPFSLDGGLDRNGLAAQVEDCLAAEVAGVALALGSELPKLTGDERRAAITHVAACLRGRAPRVVNTGADSVAATLARIDEARACGADAAMVMAPLFMPAGAGVAAGHLRAVAAAASLPVVRE